MADGYNVAMIQVVLFQPEIPGNTGNIIRLCANTGAGLHLIRPLGFDLDDKKLRRAGLDYHEWARLELHDSLDACLTKLGRPRCYALTTKGQRSVFDVAYRADDVLLFGRETAGLPAEVVAALAPEQRLRLPMQAESRSLNLSNAVAVTVYEAWRQLGFPGSA